MNAASPTKRRAALATLDANATTCSTPTPGKHHHADADPTALKPPLPLSAASRRTSGLLSSAPLLAPPPVMARAGGTPSVGMKRCSSGMVLQDRDQIHAEEQQAKKSKREHHGPEVAPAPVSTQSSTRSRTHSPDASSVFDASGAEDATWVTTATEPEFVGGGAPAMNPATTRTPPRALTREQTREKVEILRLRLGLASYKLRTGQVEVPLADLQPRPLPTTARPGHAPDPSQSSASQEDDEDEEEEEIVEATPPPPAQPTAVAALAAMASR
ncbi:cyclin-dependent kinase [Cordyceps militaris]|uniref:Cyclin-dependent kinase n=1 Tax=Cordyceps militaris TaxID=73501 RepID=A0A2H4SD18_CORMI|nr:cyclin-dependent kinase [Cordyceps militaris]